MLHDFYDIIVVGAGHAGSEAAAAAANMGSKVLLITMDMTRIAQMSCNPAMGGIAKGQIVREIDALGGFSGIVTDKTMIQFRMLNKSKGHAMRSPRAQCNRMKFSIVWREMLEETKNLEFWQDMVTKLIIERKKIVGVITKMNTKFYAKAVILTNGTFINGLIHIGRNSQSGGRAGEPHSYGISEQLKTLGFEVGRMKTGTPARLDGRTIDFSVMTEQKGDKEKGKFSFLNYELDYSNHKSCWITSTNNEVHRILERGFKDSPLYTGIIKSIGPRYCPSIEDKIVTFAEKKSHLLFIEPEGLNTQEYYLNGFSSSLPMEIQLEAMRKIKGLESIKIFRPGYAIEYDYFPPTQLKSTLETKSIKNLYFAGQINGTTGYEEAAAQGLMAGINAHLKIYRKDEFVLGRDQAYIGVLIDDLITKGVDEPYRMFTSRAEYRILLRQDNADERLTEKSYQIGLANQLRYNKLRDELKKKSRLVMNLRKLNLSPDDINDYLESRNTTRISQRTKLFDLIARPQIELNGILEYVVKRFNLNELRNGYDNHIIHAVETDIKYNGYKERERILAEKAKRLEEVRIRGDFNFRNLKSI